MAGTHGGTIVPPRDDDGRPSDEDGLVAQVIPLRQRERESAEDHLQGLESLDDGFPPPRDASGIERSVWDQPIGELRRRGAAESESDPRRPPSAYGASRLAAASSWRLLVAAAAALVTVTMLALALDGALRDQARSVPHAASFIPKTRASKTRNAAAHRPATGLSPRPQNTRAAHRLRTRQRERRSSSAHIVLRPTESTLASSSTRGHTPNQTSTTEPSRSSGPHTTAQAPPHSSSTPPAS
jgi:hypothetical protein